MLRPYFRDRQIENASHRPNRLAPAKLAMTNTVASPPRSARLKAGMTRANPTIRAASSTLS